MKKILSVFLTVCLLAGCGSICVPALAAKREANEKTYVLIEADAAGTLGGTPQNEVAAAQQDLLSKAEDAADLSVLYTYTSILNGVAAEVRKGDIETLRALNGVADVVELTGVKPVIEPVRAAGEITSGPMIGLEAAREKGLDGTGTAIAVIDGGLDVNHSAMRLSDESTAKFSKEDIAAVISSHTMNSANITADAVYKNAKVPFAFDYNGDDAEVLDADEADPNHGTHVSGIAAGNSDRLRGIAPEAQVLLFKINGYDDKLFLANLLAAIDDASKFDISGMNISSGMIFEIPSAPVHALLQKAVSRAREAGILVCTAAGNSSGLFLKETMFILGTNGIPNSFNGATSIASVDNINLSDRISGVPEYIVYNGDKTIDIWGYGSLQFPDSVEMVPIGKNGAKADLTGKCALIYEEQTDYVPVLRTVLDSDVAAVIMCSSVVASCYWSDDEEVIRLFDDIIATLPLVTVRDLDAYRLYHLKNKTVSVRYSEGYYVEPAQSLQISGYSSWGIGDDGSMTVDLAAPGGVIYSSVTNDKYDVYDGTSMASPHIVGASALLEQYYAAKPIKGMGKADFMEALLMSTADPIRKDGVPVTPRVAGAGLVNLSRALSANALLLGSETGSALNLGDGIDSTFTFSFDVRNISDKTVRYDTLSLDVCADEYETIKSFNIHTGVFEDEYMLTGKSAAFDFTMQSDMPRSINLQPGEAHTITVTVSVDEGQFEGYRKVFSNGFFIDGYVTLSDTYGEETETTLNMPFLGFAGVWDDVPALFEDYYGYTAARSLREIEYIFTDENGNVVWSTKEEYLTKYTRIRIPDPEIPDGTYTVTIKATPVCSDTAQIYTIEDYQIDNMLPEIVSVQQQRNADGSGTITVTVRDDDVYYFTVKGADYSNLSFEDIYPVDEYDRIDEDGNYVYVLEFDELPQGAFIIEAVDDDWNSWSYGSYSYLVRLVFLLRDLKEECNSILKILRLILVFLRDLFYSF